MCFESAEMCRKEAREAEEARGRKPADDLKRRDQSSAPVRPRTWLSRVIQPALAVLLLSLAAEGQAAISGPALVGSVTIMQIPNTTDATFVFAGQCRGNTANFNTTLSNFNVNNVTAANLEGLSLPGQGPAGGCLSGGEDLTVVTVVTPQFVNNGQGVVNAGHVVILYVVP